jgi:hypothetical protein
VTISVKTQKMLWGRGAGRCSKPECRIDLYEDETLTDDPTLVGENCHIIGESDDGPRGDPAIAIEQRNGYSNLILLCRNHHKIIDAQEKTYTIEVLCQMKADHERWVKEQLGLDQAKQFDDEQYAGIVDAWERRAHTDTWLDWSSNVLGSGQPRLAKQVDEDLFELRSWLLVRVWPARYADLERAFENFRRVLQDLQETFRKHAEPWGPDGLITGKFYKLDEWDERRYAELAAQFDFHVDLVADLMLELTRAANLVADRIRQRLIPSYRLEEGRFAVTYGPVGAFEFKTVVVQYSEDERKQGFPYPGLQSFLEARTTRDLHFGQSKGP